MNKTCGSCKFYDCDYHYCTRDASDQKPIVPENQLLRSMPQMENGEVKIKRCFKTGNPVGTDTWTGNGCYCPACVEYRQDIAKANADFYEKYFAVENEEVKN